MEGSASRPAELARFVTGSTMRHVVVMTGTASVGLIAIFVVDLLSLLYISWLGDPTLTAGIGLATIVSFTTVSINVGLMIAIGALVSRALGAGDRARARRLATSCCLHMVAAGGVVGLALLPALPWILRFLGASDLTLPVAETFLWIVLPSNILMAAGMGLSSVLRAIGDAERGMYVTLFAAVATAILDPIFIFGFGLGTIGAAIAIVLSRFLFAGLAYWYASRVHDLLARPEWGHFVGDARPMYAIAVPAVLTNVATPLANGVFASVIARFGDQAIAATAIIDRLVPVAFGGLFALSGAVGPILGQNWGAQRYDRMREALRDAVIFTAIYVGIVWAVLFALQTLITDLFHAEGLTADLVHFFCLVSGFMWFFIGLVFVANASFNNLGFPLLSTGFNWARATLGIVPFAFLGAHLGGPQGAVLGLAAGSIPFGIAAIATAFWTVRKLEREAA